MEKFEYRILKRDADLTADGPREFFWVDNHKLMDSPEERINKLASKGWRLIIFQYSTYILERPISRKKVSGKKPGK